MDILKIRTTFLKGIIGTIIEKQIAKKLGCHMNISLNDIDVSIDGDKVNIWVGAKVQANTKDVEKIFLGKLGS